MSKLLLFLFSLSLSQVLLSQENDTTICSSQVLYYDIEKARYCPKEKDENNEEPRDHKYEVPLGVLQPKYPEYDKENIIITDDIRDIIQSNKCDILKTINKPSYTSQSHKYFKITAIEIKECSTILHFKTKAKKNSRFSIPRGSCICISGADPMFIKAVEGNVAMGKWISKATVYKAIFPPIPQSTKAIDFKELNKGGNWFSIGLKLE